MPSDVCFWQQNVKVLVGTSFSAEAQIFLAKALALRAIFLRWQRLLRSRRSFLMTVIPALTTTSEQRPPVNNGQFASSKTSLNITFIRPLFQTATFFRSQGWSLYTGLTVFSCVKGFRKVGMQFEAPEGWWSLHRFTMADKAFGRHSILAKILVERKWIIQKIKKICDQPFSTWPRDVILILRCLFTKCISYFFANNFEKKVVKLLKSSSKQVWCSTIVSSTIVLTQFDEARLGRLFYSNITLIELIRPWFSSINVLFRSRCYVRQFFLRQFFHFSSTIQE